MDAVEYIKAKAHMCNAHKSCYRCPMSHNNNGRNKSCSNVETDYTEEAIKIVGDWWQKNKPKTNAEWAKEKLEEIGFEADIEYMRKNCCPVFKNNLFTNRSTCKDSSRCEECEKWWDELHEENAGDK